MWEGHKIWKKSPTYLDTTVVFTQYRQNKWEIFSKFLWPFQKSWTLCILAYRRFLFNIHAKVHIFRKGHNSLTSKLRWRFCQIFVVFSENLNFTIICDNIESEIIFREVKKEFSFRTYCTPFCLSINTIFCHICGFSDFFRMTISIKVTTIFQGSFGNEL